MVVGPSKRLPRLLEKSSLRAFVLLLLAGSTGCAHPSAANNQLRVENDKLQAQITALNRRHDADAASLRAQEQKTGTVPTLPSDRLDQLYTTHGIKLGKLTSGDDTDPNTPGDEGLRVAITPVDDQGDKLKAAGGITIDAFDLAAPNPHIGHWSFTPAQARANWFGSGLLYGYILKFPWQTPPTHPELTVKVTFTDSLTNREFTAQEVIKIKPPAGGATTQPTTRVAPAT